MSLTCKKVLIKVPKFQNPKKSKNVFIQEHYVVKSNLFGRSWRLLIEIIVKLLIYLFYLCNTNFDNSLSNELNILKIEQNELDNVLLPILEARVSENFTQFYTTPKIMTPFVVYIS